MFDLVPFRKNSSIGRFFDEFEKGFLSDVFNDDFFRGPLGGIRTDVRDTGKEYIIEAEMPGFDKKDISIEVKDNRLTISAKRDAMEEEKRENYIRQERHVGQVFRSFALDNVKSSEIRAEYEGGILKLTLPKLAEIPSENTRRIDIQ